VTVVPSLLYDAIHYFGIVFQHKKTCVKKLSENKRQFI